MYSFVGMLVWGASRSNPLQLPAEFQPTETRKRHICPSTSSSMIDRRALRDALAQCQLLALTSSGDFIRRQSVVRAGVWRNSRNILHTCTILLIEPLLHIHNVELPESEAEQHGVTCLPVIPVGIQLYCAVTTDWGCALAPPPHQTSLSTRPHG